MRRDSRPNSMNCQREEEDVEEDNLDIAFALLLLLLYRQQLAASITQRELGGKHRLEQSLTSRKSAWIQTSRSNDWAPTLTIIWTICFPISVDFLCFNTGICLSKQQPSFLISFRSFEFPALFRLILFWACVYMSINKGPVCNWDVCIVDFDDSKASFTMSLVQWDV